MMCLTYVKSFKRLHIFAENHAYECKLGLQKIMGLLWSHRKFWSNTTRSQLDMSFNIILLVKVH